MKEQRGEICKPGRLCDTAEGSMYSHAVLNSNVFCRAQVLTQCGCAGHFQVYDYIMSRVNDRPFEACTFCGLPWHRNVVHQHETIWKQDRCRC